MGSSKCNAVPPVSILATIFKFFNAVGKSSYCGRWQRQIELLATNRATTHLQRRGNESCVFLAQRSVHLHTKNIVRACQHQQTGRPRTWSSGSSTSLPSAAATVADVAALRAAAAGTADVATLRDAAAADVARRSSAISRSCCWCICSMASCCARSCCSYCDLIDASAAASSPALCSDWPLGGPLGGLGAPELLALPLGYGGGASRGGGTLGSERSDMASSSLSSSLLAPLLCVAWEVLVLKLSSPGLSPGRVGNGVSDAADGVLSSAIMALSSFSSTLCNKPSHNG